MYKPVPHQKHSQSFIYVTYSLCKYIQSFCDVISVDILFRPSFRLKKKKKKLPIDPGFYFWLMRISAFDMFTVLHGGCHGNNPKGTTLMCVPWRAATGVVRQAKHSDPGKQKVSNVLGSRHPTEIGTFSKESSPRKSRGSNCPWPLLRLSSLSFWNSLRMSRSTGNFNSLPNTHLFFTPLEKQGHGNIIYFSCLPPHTS